MITINSAESALKNIYLETVVNDINTKTNPFLTMIGENTKTIAEKDARVPIRHGNDSAVAAGEEAGALPTSTEKIAEIVVPLKNIFGSFQITDKALKAAQNSPGAFASLIGGEMRNLVSIAQSNLNRMVYGNGMKRLATVDITTATQTFTVPARDASKFFVGQRISFNRLDNVPHMADVRTVTSIAVSGNVATIGIDQNVVANTVHESLFVYDVDSLGVEMNGIDSLFTPETLYNLSKADYQAIMPFEQDGGSTRTTPNPLSEDDLLDFLYNLEDHNRGMATDIILTHPVVKKALFDDLRGTRSNIDVTELAGGFKGFSFNGIPMYADVRCLPGTVYALNSDSFAMHQLCDWTWLEGEDGSILRPMSGKPVYAATLVKYAELICEKPFLQGKLTNHSPTVWRG